MSLRSVPGVWGEYEDEDETNAKLISQKQALIILIDAGSHMWNVDPQTRRTPFSVAMEVTSKILRRSVISSSKRRFGIVLFGTREAANKHQQAFERVCEVSGLKEPTAHTIRSVEALYQDRKEFERRVGSAAVGDRRSAGALESALWLCHFMFTEQKLRETDSQRIWVFTTDDDPTNGDGGARKKLVQRARDLASAHRTIELWPLVDRTQFDAKKLYGSALLASGVNETSSSIHWPAVLQQNEDDGDDEEDMDTRLVEGIFGVTRRKEYAKRRLSRLIWAISPEIKLGLELFVTTSVARRPPAVQLEAKTSRQMSLVSRYLCEDTGNFLTPEQVIKCAEYGGARVFLSKDDQRCIRSFGGDNLGLELLCFKPMSSMEPWHNSRTPYFCTPDENAFKGSTQAFLALLKAMVKLQRVAIARFRSREASAPSLVALWPQAEEYVSTPTSMAGPPLETSGAVEVAAGMHVVFLPFSDDLRPLPSASDIIATDDQIEKAQALLPLAELQNFVAEDFENPALQKHFTNLEALALEDESVVWDPEDDLLRPDVETMLQNGGTELDAFSDSYGGLDEVPANTKKRGASQKDGRSGKRSKASSSADESTAAAIATIDFHSLIQDGRLKNEKVPTLKAFLSSKGLDVSGRKADLVARITAHFS